MKPQQPRRFRITFNGEIEILLNQTVIDAVDDEWRHTFYKLNTPEQIAEHIAYNLLGDVRLSMLDGWADQPDEYAEVVAGSEDWELEAKEIR